MSEHSIVDRVHTVVKEKCDVSFFYGNTFSFNDIKDVEWLIETINKNNFGVVIFDTLSASHTKEENSNSEMSIIMSTMKRIIDETKTTIIVLHHHGKSNEYKDSDMGRGATTIIGRASSHLILSKGVMIHDSNEEETIDVFHIKVKQGKSRERDSMKDFGVDISYDATNNTTSFRHTGEIEENINSFARAITYITDIFKDTDARYTKQEIIDLCKGKDIGANNTQRALKDLLEKNYIDKEVMKKKHYYYKKIQPVLINKAE